jgi:5-methylcytosine-specific restriction endonuclease McrA
MQALTLRVVSSALFNHAHIGENNGKRLSKRKRIKAGKVSKGDGKDVDHIVPLSKGGSNTPSNMRIKSKSANSSFPRNSNGSLKRNVTNKK